MTDQSPVHNLTDDEAWAFLGQREFGRLAFHLAGEVHITPINYVVDRGRILFRTAEGNKLLGMTMNQDVAFEVDDISEERATSVVLRGYAQALEGSEAEFADTLPLRAWVPTHKHVVVAVTPIEMSGRSFDLNRPWLQARKD